MKYQTITTGLTALALSAVIAVAAENTPNPTNTRNHNLGNQWLVDSSKLDGATVWDFHGNKLGDLQQVLVDPESGRIRYGILEVDKTWNWSDPMVAIPWSTFAVKRGDDKVPTISIDTTKERLETAPKFKIGDADRLYGKEASEPIYSYWGHQWIDDSTTTGRSGQMNTDPQRNGTRTNTPGSNNGTRNNNTNPSTGTNTSTTPTPTNPDNSTSPSPTKPTNPN